MLIVNALWIIIYGSIFLIRYPELLTRMDIKLFLPPIGGLTIYMWGDPDTIPDEDIPLTVRVHDECNGSDVFGSDICTCRPYLAHAIEECIKTGKLWYIPLQPIELYYRLQDLRIALASTIHSIIDVTTFS
jgi:hypothetical protein